MMQAFSASDHSVSWGAILNAPSFLFSFFLPFLPSPSERGTRTELGIKRKIPSDLAHLRFTV